MQKKLKALKKAHKHVTHAVHMDKSNKKDPRAPAMAEFLLDTEMLEKQFKLIVATRDEGVEYTRTEIVAFARTADELVRSAMAILRGEWKPGRAGALRIRQCRDGGGGAAAGGGGSSSESKAANGGGGGGGKLKREHWVGHLVQVTHASEEYQRILNDEDLLRVKQQWCELLAGEKGLCLQYRTSQKGASDGEVLKVVTYPVPNYKGAPAATLDSIYGVVDKHGRRSGSSQSGSGSGGGSKSSSEQEFGGYVTETENPLETSPTSSSRGNETTAQQQELRWEQQQIESFSVVVRELQDDGDVDTEDLICEYYSTCSNSLSEQQP
jgi:uncharacterized membrane protein YgcG